MTMLFMVRTALAVVLWLAAAVVVLPMVLVVMAKEG